LMMLIRLGEPHEPVQMQRMMLRLAEFVIAHRKPLFWGNLLVILALAACIPLNKFGDNYVEFFDDSIRFHNDAEFVNERLMGQQMLEYPIPAGGPGGVNEPEFQRQLEALGEWFAQQPETRKVTSMVDLMKNLNQTISGGDAAQYKLPETRARSAQYLLFYEMSLPVGVDLTDIINIDKSAAKLTVMLDTISSEELIALDQRAVAWMRANLPESMVVHASGVPVMFAHVARRNFESMIVGTGLAFGLISTLLLLAFKSLRLGLISLVPNLVPAIVGFGVWGLLVGQAGMSLAVVVSLTLGIVVDDTVHLLSKYRRAREERGLSAEDAIRYAFSSVGMALWITSAVLVLGFCLIMISSFTLTVHLGALTAVVIACALLADFFFLPPLLMKLDSQQQSLAADR
ncbi:MAG: efflux RND transporter permease subunit, partial [Nevskiales bacterium]